MPQVSVVIPVYNAIKFLRETLGHVFAQTFKDYEVVVVDDGSTDNSVSVVEEIAERYARPVRIISQANQGAAAARNTGARAAQGQYLAFLDADDIWYPQKLGREVEVLEKGQGAIMAWSNWDVVDGVGRMVDSGFPAHQLTSCDDTPLTKLLGKETRCVHLSAMLVHRTVFEQIGGFDPDVFPIEDYDLSFRLFNFGHCVFLKENLAAYRNHPEGVSKVGLLHGVEIFCARSSDSTRVMWISEDSSMCCSVICTLTGVGMKSMPGDAPRDVDVSSNLLDAIQLNFGRIVVSCVRAFQRQ